MNPKKILYIHHGKGLGGAPLSLLYLIEALDKNLYHPVVLFLHHSDAFDLYVSKGIEVYGPVNLYDFSHTRIWWFKWYHIPYLLRSIKDTYKTWNNIALHWFEKIKPDIIHLNTSSLIAWGIVAHKKKIPIVWHIREPLASGYLGLRRTLIKLIVGKYATLITPICKHDAQPWARLPKTHVLYNAVDSQLFNYTRDFQHFLTHYKLSQNTPKILFLGGLSQEKGTLIILQVLEKLLEKLPETRLLIAGYFEKSYAQNVLKNFFPAHLYKKKVLAQLNKVQNSVTFLGPINTIPEAMAACNIIVFPATVGHFARPIIEAGFMKKPVIASNLAPLDELIIDKKTGYLIEHKDIACWSNALYTLLVNTTLAQDMGNQAFDFCTKHFDIKQQKEKIEGLYSKFFL